MRVYKLACKHTWYLKLCLQIDELTTELESMKNHQLNPVLEGQNPTDIVRKYNTHNTNGNTREMIDYI